MLVPPATHRKSAAKLRKHSFCALSDDPRLAEQWVAVNHSPNTGATSWRATATASPFLSPNYHHSPFGADDSTVGGWGMASPNGAASGVPPSPNWDTTSYVSPRIVSSPHTLTDGCSTATGDFTPYIDDDEVPPQQQQKQQVADVKELPRPDKLSVSSMGQGDGRHPVEPTPLLAASPEERRRSINEMTFTPSRYDETTR